MVGDKTKDEARGMLLLLLTIRSSHTEHFDDKSIMVDRLMCMVCGSDERSKSEIWIDLRFLPTNLLPRHGAC